MCAAIGVMFVWLVVWPAKIQAEEAAGQGAYHLERGAIALTELNTERGLRHFKLAHQYFNEAEKIIEPFERFPIGMVRLFDVSGGLKARRSLLAAATVASVIGQEVSQLVPPPSEPFLGLTLVDFIQQKQPQLWQVLAHTRQLEKNLADIQVNSLPVVYQARLPRVQHALAMANTLASSLLHDNNLLHLLGADRERRYLLIFQNPDEMRPTGGFIGTIGLISVDRGRLQNIDITSVYDVDGQLLEFLAPPTPLKRITPRWFLRDANWFVDFPTSAQKIAEFLEKEKGPTVDGVVAVTPQIVEELLKITGPIEMPQYGIKVDDQNFKATAQRLVTYEYDRQQNRPKQFLADLSAVLLDRLTQQSSGYSAHLLQAAMTMADEKNLLFYFAKESLQEQVRQLGWAGALPADAPGLLYVNNANIGGHKSDQFIQQKIYYDMYLQHNGDVEVLLTIDRTHHGPRQGVGLNYPPEENPAVKDNVVYQRVLVTKPAQLFASQGFTPATHIQPLVEVDPTLPLVNDEDVDVWHSRQELGGSGTVVGEEAGYTYFANWMITRPGETSRGVYRYRIPAREFSTQNRSLITYPLKIIKQPGDAYSDIRLAIHAPEKWRGMKVIAPPLLKKTASDTQWVIYEGSLTQDLAVGVVYEKN